MKKEFKRLESLCILWKEKTIFIDWFGLVDERKFEKYSENVELFFDEEKDAKENLSSKIQVPDLKHYFLNNTACGLIILRDVCKMGVTKAWC